MVLETIISGQRAWASANLLTRRYGTAAITRLARAGIIECWNSDSTGRKLHGAKWTLSTWGAAQLGVTIVETPSPDGVGVPRWTRGDDEDVPRRKCALATPRYPPAPRPRVEVLRDAEGEPILLWGREVPIERRARKVKPRVPVVKVGYRRALG